MRLDLVMQRQSKLTANFFSKDEARQEQGRTEGKAPTHDEKVDIVTEEPNVNEVHDIDKITQVW